ncbi:MAG: hypothetical protein WCP01_09400 [Methylococcaceae bacterium]
MEIIIIFIIVVVLGALSGATSFGETIKEGCGCIVSIVTLVVIAGIFLASK